MDKKVPIRDSLKWGWSAFKEHFGFLVGTTIFIIGASMLFSYLTDDINQSGEVLPILLLNTLFWVASTIVTMGWTKVYLKICDSQKPEFADLFSQAPLFFKYLGASILYGLAVVGGLILLVIPGIIFALKYMFAQVLVIERGYGPIEAMKKSAEITKGVKGQLLLFNIVQMLLMVAGVIALFVGMLVAIPVVMLAEMYVYRHLLYQTELGGAPEPQQPTETSAAI